MKEGENQDLFANYSANSGFYHPLFLDHRHSKPSLDENP
jgi:hypothetical protein